MVSVYDDNENFKDTLEKKKSLFNEESAELDSIVVPKRANKSSV